jgi:hypothetical protein
MKLQVCSSQVLCITGYNRNWVKFKLGLVLNGVQKSQGRLPLSVVNVVEIHVVRLRYSSFILPISLPVCMTFHWVFTFLFDPRKGQMMMA